MSVSTLNRLEPQTGTAFELRAGQELRVIDIEGEQVADLIAFNRSDKSEWLSSGRSIDYANRIYLTKGDVLYSNRSRPMLTIIEDDVGRHDFAITYRRGAVRIAPADVATGDAGVDRADLAAGHEFGGDCDRRGRVRFRTGQGTLEAGRTPGHHAVVDRNANDVCEKARPVSLVCYPAYGRTH